MVARELSTKLLLKDQHFPVVIPSFVHLTEQRGSGGGSWGIEEFFTSKISSKETLAKVSLPLLTLLALLFP